MYATVVRSARAVLYIGREILVPIVFSIMVMYVILGAARLLSRVPVIGPALPMQAHYALSTLLMLGALLVLGWLAMDSVDQLLARVPHYQSQLVALVQRGAALVGIESEPSWDGIRAAVVAQVNLQRLAGSALNWGVGMIGGLTVVGLYVAFLMIERRHFDAKIDRLSPDPARGTQVRRIIGDVNRRIAPTWRSNLLSVLLVWSAGSSWPRCGVELAPFWALVIGCSTTCPTSARCWAWPCRCCSHCCSSATSGRRWYSPARCRWSSFSTATCSIPG